MKKIIIIAVFCFLLAFETVSAAECKETEKSGEKGTNYCTITSNYVFQEKCQHDIAEYKEAVNEIYSQYATTEKSIFTKISCREMIAFKAPKITDITVYSGVGFDYSPIIVTNTFVCKGIVEYNLFNFWYSNVDSNAKKAMKAELELYSKWTNNLENFLKGKVTSDKLIVTLNDKNNTKYKEINKETEMVEQTLKSTNEKEVSKILNTKEKVNLWVKKIDVISTFEPILKKTITSGSDYGKVIKNSERCSNCTVPDRKLYTDFETGSGNFKLTTNIEYKNKDWTILSDCGYNIYNNGSVSWDKRFIYRQISLSNPFPKGANGYWTNWEKDKLITGNEYNTVPDYVVNLNTASIKSIREYNKSNDYNTDLSSNYVNGKYKSDFIIKHASIFSKAG